GMDPRPDGRPRRARAAGRLLRQPRHRHPDARGEPHPARGGGDPPVGERDARHRAVPVRRRGRPRPDQRGQADDLRAAFVELLQLRRQLRDDPRWAHRSHRARRDGGERRGRHRQLDDPGQDDQGHGRGDGPRRRRQEDHRGDGAQRQGRLAEVHPGLHLAADWQERGGHDHHGPGRVPAVGPPFAVPPNRDRAGRGARRGAGEDDGGLRRRAGGGL
ncbi:MAG: Succinyl-CoA:3-ketoacid-coenzyme A transferase subunit B, partial [uncultured Sphingomonadaceae bacterium]